MHQTLAFATLAVGGLRLQARQPADEELESAAPELAAAYNDPHNKAMMAHSDDMTPQEVIEAYRKLGHGGGGMVFLLYCDGVLVGDADLRHMSGRDAEFAFMIGARAIQGKGLGTRFAIMIHALAYRQLGLERIYVTILPQNVASRRVFEKLGYAADNSAQARKYADDDTDICMSATRAQFEAVHGEAAKQVQLGYM